MSAWADTRSAHARIPATASGQRLLFGLLLMVIAWAPVPIGSNREWSMSLLSAGALAIVGLWLLAFVCRATIVPDSVRFSRSILVLLSLWAVYPLVQILPLPMGVVNLLGGDVHALYSQLAEPSRGTRGFLSLDRGATLSGFLRECGLSAFFAATLLLITSAKRLRILMVVMLAVGFAEAFYGLAVHLAGDELALWNPGQADGVISGTYVNQNHFAGLMEITIPVGLGLLLASPGERGGVRGGRDLARVLSGLILGQRGLILCCVLVMVAALIMTTSRGGTGALAAGVAIAIVIAVCTRGVRARELGVGVVAVALAVSAILWLGAGRFSDKLKTTGFDSNRAELAQVSYRIIEDSPLVGTGVGTYRWVFPLYKDERFGGYFYEHAHNDFLEVIAEQGLVGFALLTAALAFIFFRIVQSYAARKDPLMRGVLFASVAGGCSILIHGLVDFNLQIPANAAYFFVLLASGVVACRLPATSERHDRARMEVML